MLSHALEHLIANIMPKPVVDLLEVVDVVSLVEQHLGHIKVVQLGLADTQVAVDDQAADEQRVADQHGGFQVLQVDVGAVERAEEGPGGGHGAVEHR